MSLGHDATRPPNVVLMLTDDQGWGDLSLNGNTNLATPCIDRLARDGAVFDTFCVQPLCAPTRAEILTGRYFPRTGVRGVTRRAECLALEETTLGDVFRAADRPTGCFGKWHSGSAYPYHPNGRGFDEFFGFCCGHWSHYFDSTLERNGRELTAPGYIVDALTEQAMAFIDNHRNEPFLCYVPFNTPHSPFQVPDRWFDKFADRVPGQRHRDPDKEELDVTRSVLAMCENIDWNVGRLVEHVTRLGLRENTIFVYLSDNGPNSWRWNGGMRGRKGSTDEGGVRSPCILAWPGHIAGGTRIRQVAGSIDLLPTLADLAGASLPRGNPLDGTSLRPLLEGRPEAWNDRNVFAQSPDGKRTSVRTDRYRAGGDTGGLYDMTADTGQRVDLSAELPGLAARLRDAVARWRDDVLPVPRDNPPIPVGYRAFPRAFLNAQDGLPSGDITWSSVHPNASFFVEWHDPADAVRWEIDVQTAGRYEVTLMYTCCAGDEGAELAVACAGSQSRARIEKAFDPPLKNRQDRVKRSESYEKAFFPARLGTLELPRGRHDISLRALSKPGRQVCDVRALKLALL